jgi:hypothetical protein
LAVGRSSLLLHMATVRAAAAVAVVAATAVRGASAWMRMSRRGRLARLLAGFWSLRDAVVRLSGAPKGKLGSWALATMRSVEQRRRASF